MRLQIALVLLLAAADVAAAVYKWTKPDGSVIYSDRPPAENATPAELPPVQEITIVPPPADETATDGDAQAAEEDRGSRESAYTQLTITSPQDQSVLRGNAGDVSVSIDLKPGLRSGDKLAIILDGHQIGQGAGTSINLSNVDRGTHTLQVAVKNSDGSTLIQSSPVTFTVQRTSLLQPKR